MAVELVGQATHFDFAGVRLVVTDLDDTLLRTDKTISARTHAAIAAVQRAGVVFAVASARPPRTMVPIAREVGVGQWGAACNGAILYDLLADAVVADFAISPAVAQGVIRALRRALPGITFGCEVGGRFGCEPRYEELRPYARQQGVWRADALTLAEHPLTKLMALYPALPSDDLLAQARAVVGDAVNCTHSGLPLVEISAAGVDKGAGVAALCARLGIALSTVIACGDMPNDLPMLRRVGLGVAVANAHPDVLATAAARTAAADADGLADVLDRVLAAHAG